MVHAQQQPSSQEVEEKRRAVDVGAHLKKLLDTYRTYEEGHSVLPSLELALFEKIKSYLDEFGDFALELSALSLTHAGKAIVTAERREDSLAFPFFAEGVQELVFFVGLYKQELDAFLQIWRKGFITGGVRADRQKDALLTEFWEHDFQFIEMLVITSSMDAGSGEDGDAGGRDELRRFMGALASPRTGVADDEGPGVPPDDPGAAALLGAELSMEITPEMLLPPAQPIGVGNVIPRPEHLAALAKLIEKEAEQGVVDHFINAVFEIAAAAGEKEVPALEALLGRAFDALSAARRFRDIASSIERARESAAADPATSASRYALLERFVSTLETAAIVGRAIDALDVPETHDGAVAMLGETRSAALPLILDELGRPKTQRGAESLVRVLASKKPSGEELAARAKTASPEVARIFLSLMEGRPESEALLVQRAVLEHEDAGTRKKMVESLSVDDYRKNSRAFQRLLADPDQGIRRAILGLAMKAKDRSAAGKLGWMLESATVEDGERKSVLHALGIIGGIEAGIVARKYFQSAKDLDLKCAAALALGQMGDQASRPLLEEAMNKVLARPKLKAACAEALRRLGAPP